MIAFAYYRQMLDPSSPANASRAPSSQVRRGAFPTHYDPPYNASVPNLGYDAPYTSSGGYAPPPGPPPQGHLDEQFAPPYEHGDGKLPGYGAGFGDDMKDMDTKDSKEDPFSDFDGPSAPAAARMPEVERDVTSRPGPGGRDTFSV